MDLVADFFSFLFIFLNYFPRKAAVTMIVT